MSESRSGTTYLLRDRDFHATCGPVLDFFRRRPGQQPSIQHSKLSASATHRHEPGIVFLDLVRHRSREAWPLSLARGLFENELHLAFGERDACPVLTYEPDFVSPGTPARSLADLIVDVAARSLMEHLGLPDIEEPLHEPPAPPAVLDSIRMAGSGAHSLCGMGIVTDGPPRDDDSCRKACRKLFSGLRALRLAELCCVRLVDPDHPIPPEAWLARPHSPDGVRHRALALDVVAAADEARDLLANVLRGQDNRAAAAVPLWQYRWDFNGLWNRGFDKVMAREWAVSPDAAWSRILYNLHHFHHLCDELVRGVSDDERRYYVSPVVRSRDADLQPQA